MFALRFAAPLVAVALIVGGCGGEKEVAMPNVTSKKLDVAYDKLKAAGFDDKDKIKVDGGGLFGIVVESNWTVCKQSPAPGEPVAETMELSVKKSCKKKPISKSSEDKPAPTAASTTKPKPTKDAPAKQPAIITAKNNREFASLLKLGDDCSDKIGRFAEKYADKKFKFDGSISAFAAHDGRRTRFDMLVGPGDKGANSSRGPSFQFYDKNAFDLNLTGKNIPDNLMVNQKYTFTASIEEWNAGGCQLRLRPIETKTR